MPIRFYNHEINYTLKHRGLLKQFIRSQIKASTHKHLDIDFIFCTDQYLLEINRQFLNHDYYTDIITFPLESNPGLLKAEIYISLDRVRDNSLKFVARHPKTGKATSTPNTLQKGERTELLRVIFHGILHLLGYKDKTKTDKEAMTKAEDRWITAYEKVEVAESKK